MTKKKKEEAFFTLPLTIVFGGEELFSAKERSFQEGGRILFHKAKDSVIFQEIGDFIQERKAIFGGI